MGIEVEVRTLSGSDALLRTSLHYDRNIRDQTFVHNLISSFGDDFGPR